MSATDTTPEASVEEADLGCPWPVRIHPGHSRLVDDLAQWCAAVGLPDPPHHQQALLAAAAHPDVLPDRLLLAAMITVWVLSFDDRGEQLALHEQARLAVSVLRIFEHGDHRVDLDAEPMLRATDDLARRLRTVTAPHQYGRFLGGVTEFALGQLAGQIHSHVAPREIGVADYRLLRRYDSGLLMLFSVADALAGWELPPRLWYDPQVTAATRTASQIICLTNDFFSWRREDADPHTAHLHLPGALARDLGITSEQAAVRLGAEVADRYRRFAAMRREIAQRGEPDADRYLTALSAWLAGHDHWITRTRRHQETTRSLT